MDILTRENLTSLASHRGWPSVSLFLPTHKLPRQWAEDRIRLKNLLRQAQERMVDEGMRSAEVEAVSRPVQAVYADDSFWRDIEDGLAIFFSAGDVRVLKLDIPLPEQMVVGDRYYLRPLLTAYRTDESFWLLALDKNLTRLFRGDRTGIDQVDLGDAPTTIDEALKYEDLQRPQTAVHSITAGHSANRGGNHEGSAYATHGGLKDADLGYTAAFAKMVSDGVARKLVKATEPLLVVGNERLLAAYKDVNTYPNFQMNAIGASDYIAPRELQSLALKTLAPHFDETVRNDLQDLTNNEGSSLASHSAKEIATAAATGRVKTLFFDSGVGPFGVLDRDTLEVKHMCEESPRYLREQADQIPPEHDGECGWDLVDLSAAETVAHGGEIHAFMEESPPVSGMAAVFRY